MPPSPRRQHRIEPETETTLEGTLEKIVFTNEENAWSVLKVAVDGRRGPVTVVGNVLGIQTGDTLRFAGHWVQDKKWGEQFRANSYKVVSPATLEGIKRYLASGLIRGVGKKMADRLVKKFGLATLEVIEHHPERLRQVEGIGPKRCKQILEAWDEHREVQRVMVFLQSHGVSTAFAIRIYKTYGKEAEQLVTENPYRLAADVRGIGFRSADAIAEQLGIPRDSPRRIEAGLLYLLEKASEQGHLYLPEKELVDRTAELLEVGTELPSQGIETLLEETKLVEEILETGGRALFSAPLHNAETALAAALTNLSSSPPTLPDVQVENAIRWFEQREQLELAEQQQEAVARALTSKVTVITGGPGTGKTTLLRCIVDVLAAKGSDLLLAAPTGRAARRLAEATGRPARTVHRLLEYDPTQRRFLRGPLLPLEGDLVIIDEASMLDTHLARAVVEAVPEEGHLLLVGDVDQLPSVGPGRVLADLISSGAVPVVRLTEIFRQAAQSRIVVNAHRINQGQMPLLDAPAPSRDTPPTDFFFIPRDDPESLQETLVYVVAERIPESFGFDPLKDVQVLTPMNRGPLGVHTLNQLLQDRLNPSGTQIEKGGRRLRLGDKVMQLRNNYELDVFNGDLGRVVSFDPEEEELSVVFDGRRVTYAPADLDELTPAYACSIHKSQGSEYPCVVVPVHYQHFRMLQRNLIYTALTRAKKLAVFVGQKKALATAVQNQDTRRRNTRLAWRLGAGPGAL